MRTLPFPVSGSQNKTHTLRRALPKSSVTRWRASCITAGKKKKKLRYWSLCSTLDKESRIIIYIQTFFSLVPPSHRQIWYSLNLLHDFAIDFYHSASADFLMMSHWVIPGGVCGQGMMRTAIQETFSENFFFFFFFLLSCSNFRQ